MMGSNEEIKKECEAGTSSSLSNRKEDKSEIVPNKADAKIEQPEKDQPIEVKVVDPFIECEEEYYIESAECLLGGLSDDTCTYSQGNIRQALYSCLTCTPESKGSPSAVCYACSEKCHTTHQLVEMYSRRKFQCECGNKKYGLERPCKLVMEKHHTQQNNSTHSTHNFWGRFCICDNPYPDPGWTNEDLGDEGNTMYNCFICEDWFHAKCVSVDLEPYSDLEFGTLICPNCFNEKEGIRYYAAMLRKSLEAIKLVDYEKAFNIKSNKSNAKGPKGKEDTNKPTDDNKNESSGSNTSIKTNEKTVPGKSPMAYFTKARYHKYYYECYTNLMKTKFGIDMSLMNDDSYCFLAKMKEKLTEAELDKFCEKGKGHIVEEKLFYKVACKCKLCKKYYADVKLDFILDQSNLICKLEEEYYQRKKDREDSMGGKSIVDIAECIADDVGLTDPISRTFLSQGLSEYKESLNTFLKEMQQKRKTPEGEEVKELEVTTEMLGPFLEQLKEKTSKMKKMKRTLEKTTPNYDCHDPKGFL